MNAPVLSIVTGTRDRPESLAGLVASILRHTPMEFEVLIGDAGTMSLQPMPDNFIVVPEVPRLGPSKGYNKLFSLAQGEYVCWLNDDVEVLPGWAENAIQFLEAHPQVGIAALYFKDGYFPRDTFGIQSHWGMCYANFGLLRQETGERIAGDAYPIGGWMDPRIWFYGNDNSICLRSLRSGLGVVGVPDARIIHHRPRGRPMDPTAVKSRRADMAVLDREFRPFLPQLRRIYDETSRPLQGPLLLREPKIERARA